MQQTIGVTEARSKFGELVDQVRYRGDTVVLMKSGKPAAALVPYFVLERLVQTRDELFSIVDAVQANNRDLAMSDAELMAYVGEAVQAVERKQSEVIVLRGGGRLSAAPIQEVCFAG